MAKPSKPKIITEVIKRYYVMIDDWTYGGPFDTREEAQDCLKNTPRTYNVPEHQRCNLEDM